MIDDHFKKMFSILLELSRSYDPRYSIVAPIELTNISEIGNWTLRGSSTILKKKFIRLTSANIDNYGGICQRVPTMFENWDVEMEFRCQGGSQGGHSIGFLYSEELCNELTSSWNGVLVYINTSHISNDGGSPIYVIPDNGREINIDNEKPVNSIKIREQTTPTRIRLTRSGDHFSGYAIIGASQTMQKLFDIKIPGLIRFGYFTITGFSNSKGDNNDLLSFTTYSPTIYDMPEYNYDISYKNRKIIEDAVLERRELKMKRRSAMPVSYKFINESERLRHQMKGTSNLLKQAFLIVNEADRRAQETVTASDLNRYIRSSLLKSISTVLEKTNLEFSSLGETEGQVNEMWTYLRTQLRDLAIETKKDMEKLREEILNKANAVELGEIQPESIINVASSSEVAPSSNLQLILTLIMIIEFVAYISFFFVERKKTHNFVHMD